MKDPALLGGKFRLGGALPDPAAPVKPGHLDALPGLVVPVEHWRWRRRPDSNMANLFQIVGAFAFGVEGKRSLWRALQAVAGSESGALGSDSPQSGILDLDGLVHRAQVQIDRLESHRLTAAIDAFSAGKATG